MSEEQQAESRRILCIDGGGILGVFPAAFLACIEQNLDCSLSSYFDLISGTSTGGIIAIGLAMGISASDLVKLYEEHGSEIFGCNDGSVKGRVKCLIRATRRMYRSKYDATNLRIALNGTLGDKRIGDAKTRLVIPAWNSVTKSPNVYKTAHHPRLKNDYKSLAVDVALATAAAPTYFPQHITSNSVSLVDGGIWANNPIAIAVTEAITLLNWPRNSLHVLSVGCLDEIYTVPKNVGVRHIKKILKLFIDGQSYGAMGIAKLLTGHEHERTAIHRVNPAVPYNTYRMDDSRVIKTLKGLGYTLARERQPILEPVFFLEPAEVFNPIYRN